MSKKKRQAKSYTFKDDQRAEGIYPDLLAAAQELSAMLSDQERTVWFETFLTTYQGIADGLPARRFRAQVLELVLPHLEPPEAQACRQLIQAINRARVPVALLKKIRNGVASQGSDDDQEAWWCLYAASIWDARGTIFDTHNTMRELISRADSLISRAAIRQALEKNQASRPAKEAALAAFHADCRE